MGMQVGDVVEVDLPPELAFGSKGRRASAGKPSIPGGATVRYKVALVSIPGKDEELLEVTGGSSGE
jgi:peptidylprolyl isomerase